jgi:tetratricopeptide (TPR) repeat protein
MQKAAKSNFALINPSSKAMFADFEIAVSKGGTSLPILLSQMVQGLHCRRSLQEIANRLIELARNSYNLRDIKTLQEASLLLMNLPLSDARQVGLYHQAHALDAKGRSDEAQYMLEVVAEKASNTYKSRAIHALGLVHLNRGQFEDSMRLFVEAARAGSSKGSRDLITLLLAYSNISIIKSVNGDHKEALADLEKLWPLVRLIAPHSPFYFYVYHADIAYELAFLSRIEEAEAAIKIALNSPFAKAYPNWLETRDEIAAKRQAARSSHSQVAVDCAQQQRPSIQPCRKLKNALAFGFLICKADYLRSPAQTIASAGEYGGCIARLIIQRIHRCIRPRSPPALS